MPLAGIPRSSALDIDGVANGEDSEFMQSGVRSPQGTQIENQSLYSCLFVCQPIYNTEDGANLIFLAFIDHLETDRVFFSPTFPSCMNQYALVEVQVDAMEVGCARQFYYFLSHRKEVSVLCIAHRRIYHGIRAASRRGREDTWRVQAPKAADHVRASLPFEVSW